MSIRRKKGLENPPWRLVYLEKEIKR